MRLDKYVGQTITIIYTDQQAGFSQRRIKLLAVDGEHVRAYCLERRAPRTFRLDSILAVDASLRPRRRTS